jgi:hypothetical protein
LTAWSLWSDLVFLLLHLFRKSWSHESSLELQQVTDPSVTLTFVAAAAVRFIVIIVVLIMVYELSVQDLALMHFASSSTVLNLSLYEALML